MTSPAIARVRIFASLLLAAACGGKDVGPNEPPVAAAGGPYATNTGVVSFDGSGSSDADGDALTYNWDFGDGANGSGAQPTHTYRATGSYTVRLTVTDARGGASAPASTSAQVSNVGPTVDAGTSKAVPVGAPYAISATFTDGAEGPWDYSIQWGDGTTSDGDRSSPGTITATHAYASEASYRVVVNVRDRLGANGSDSLTLTATPPVLVGAGDIGDCLRTGDDSTGALLDRIEGVVMPLGDNAYVNGTAQEYANCFDPAWGRHKSRMRPVAGNHDYNTPGATGYYGYFGAAAGDPAKGYYSYTLGSWFVIVLNTGTDSPPNYAVGSPQEQWLRAELAAHSEQCVLAMFHHPRFSTVLNRAQMRPEVKPIWDALYQYGADLVINGHDHSYQRFAPQTPDGVADPVYGIRQIVAGTGGGEGLYQWGDVVPNLEVRDNETWGVLKVTLRQGSYDWQFVPITGKTFTDSGSGTCHGRPM